MGTPVLRRIASFLFHQRRSASPDDVPDWLRERGDRLMLNSRNLILTALATVAAGFLLIPRGGVRAGADPTSPNKVMAMFACNPARNMVNLVEKNVPTEWEVPKSAADKGKNIKWIAKLGSVAYGLTVAGDKAFVGTNNHGPRNK